VSWPAAPAGPGLQWTIVTIAPAGAGRLLRGRGLKSSSPARRPGHQPHLLDDVPCGYPFCPGGVAVPLLGARCMALSIIRLQLSIMRVISEFAGIMPDVPPRPLIMP
jgi:hypothetical protein